jgi:hypothetical protein
MRGSQNKKEVKSLPCEMQSNFKGKIISQGKTIDPLILDWNDRIEHIFLFISWKNLSLSFKYLLRVVLLNRRY